MSEKRLKERRYTISCIGGITDSPEGTLQLVEVPLREAQGEGHHLIIVK